MTTLNARVEKLMQNPQILFQISTHKLNKVAKMPFESLKYTDHLLTFGRNRVYLVYTLLF